MRLTLFKNCEMIFINSSATIKALMAKKIISINSVDFFFFENSMLFTFVLCCLLLSLLNLKNLNLASPEYGDSAQTVHFKWRIVL